MDCFVEVLADEMVGPVCVPALADVALADVARLHTNTRPHAWANWCVQTGHDAAHQGDEQRFEHFYLSLQAASAGLGMAIASRFMVEQDLVDGRLIAPYGFCGDGSQYCLLSPSDFVADTRKLAFLTWLRAQFN